MVSQTQFTKSRHRPSLFSPLLFLHFRMCFDLSVSNQDASDLRSERNLCQTIISLSYSPDSATDLLPNVKLDLGFSPSGVLGCSSLGIVSAESDLMEHFRLTSTQPELLSKPGGFALRHACLISGMNKAQRQVLFLESFQKLCWTTRIIVWSESCACRRVFSAGSSWIMVAVREKAAARLRRSVWEPDKLRQLR